MLKTMPWTASSLHKKALDMAQQAFLQRDPAQMAQAAGAGYNEPAGEIECVFLGHPCQIHVATAQVECAALAPLFDNPCRTLVLNNLLTATGRALSGRAISPREVKGTGAANIAGVHGYDTARLARLLDADPARLYTLLKTLPGTRATLGNASITIELLCPVPLTIVFWAGEDGLIPPELTLLLDANVCDYTPPKDVAVLLDLAMHCMTELLG